MNKIKNILNRITNVASKYPRYLFIVGILFGVTLTCFIGNIALKNNNIENVNKNNEKNITDKSIKNKENYEEKDNTIQEIKNDTIDKQSEVTSIKNNENEQEKNTKSNIESNINPDEYITEYFTETENMIDSSNKDDETIANKLKTRINILSEFLFNNGKINGFTLEQVSDDVKLKLNKIMLNIDDKVEERFPKYKNNIKDGYEEIKANATIKYLEVLDKICNQDREYLCNEAKRDFNKMKDSFKLTFSLIKDLAIKGKNNLLEYFNN